MEMRLLRICKITDVHIIKNRIIFFVILLSFGCNQNKLLYQKASTHTSLAILPFDVKLNLTKGQEKVLSEKDKAVLSQTLSVDLQKKLFNHYKKYLSKNKTKLSLQNVDETIAILAANKITFYDLHSLDKTKILNLLRVDAVIDPKMTITQKGAAFSGIGIIPLPILAITSVDVYNLFINFSAEVKLQSSDTVLWKYNVLNGYQAKNKIIKNKVEASDNFLLPLFLNVDDLFKVFITKQPYGKFAKN